MMKIYMLCVLVCASLFAACIESEETEQTALALTSKSGYVAISDVLAELQSMSITREVSEVDADIKGGIEYSSLDELHKLWWDNGCQAIPAPDVCTTIEVAIEGFAEKPKCERIVKIKGPLKTPTLTECTRCCVKNTDGTQSCTDKCKPPQTIKV
jgi:hypothetical protein